MSAAVKNDLALVAGAVGPYRRFGPEVGSGNPSGANLQWVLDMGKYVNSVYPAWRSTALTVTPIRWCRAACW